jgi:histidyl-tRNA synthetase
MMNPRGMKDFGPEEMQTRSRMIREISELFELRGACQIDTPILERKDVLFDQYGEEQKLVFDLEDQGGVPCSLRYDLTVPFARYMASNEKTKMKRYQIGKVYRRDDPSVLQGRFREFYQCDFDIAGETDIMVADAEILKTLVDILSIYKNYFNYTIKLNDKRLLDIILINVGVPNEKITTVCSSIDKLDKMKWENVAEELNAKGLSADCIQNLKDMIQIKGNPSDVLRLLQTYTEKIPEILPVLSDLEILFGYLEAFGVINFITFDASLARGLSYYTGIIFEAVSTNKNNNVGSIAAGCRYDNLIGKFSRKQIKSVGCSIGLERLFTIVNNVKKEEKEDTEKESVYLTYFYEKDNQNQNKEMFKQVLSLASFLWKNNVKCKFVDRQDMIMKEQIMSCINSNDIGYMMIFGSNELKNGEIVLKTLKNRKQRLIKIENIMDYKIE